MDQTFQTTSFIPKKPLASVRPRASKGVSIFTVVAVLFLLGTIAFSVFNYVFTKNLRANLAELESTLDKAKEKFSPVSIEDLKQLDKRINTAEKILANHITLSPILVNVLNANTLKKVQYTQFSHTVTGSGTSAKIQVRLAGNATSLPYVALQSKKLAENTYVQNPIFSDIVTAKDDTVTFNLLFDLNPNLIIYTKLIQDMSGPKLISGIPIINGSDPMLTPPPSSSPILPTSNIINPNSASAL